MLVLFVHGWSVTDTNTYAMLPEALAAQAEKFNLTIDIKHIWLGRYVSFHDEVSVADIARGFDRALRDTIPKGSTGIEPFSCIAHSTGGPVVREWIDRFYGPGRLKKIPLRHLIMLAPANHGSALAILGKRAVGRIHAWFNGVEPGQRVLDWLSLGSPEQIALARSFLQYDLPSAGVFPFVLTGQSIDRKFYDFINGYLAEDGSDGVVRVPSANLNYSMIRLVESDDCEAVNKVQHGFEDLTVRELVIDGVLRRPKPTPFGVIRKTSHSGGNKGIMGSVRSKQSSRHQVKEILKCLEVDSITEFSDRATKLAQVTNNTQETERCSRYSMLVFSICDDQGDPVEDYDLFLLGSDDLSPDKLSRDFFVDRQQNAKHKNNLVYYVDTEKIKKKGLTGFRIIARPRSGFAYYEPVQYSAVDELNDYLKENETFYVEIRLKRRIVENIFEFDRADAHHFDKGIPLIKKSTRSDFKKIEPRTSTDEKADTP